MSSELHAEFLGHDVQTGEMFDRDAWVRLTGEYPGFQDFTLEGSVG